MLTLIIALAIAFGVSFVCSFFEAGLLSLTPADVALLAKEDPVRGRIWTDFKTNIGRPISVILLLNTTAHTIGASVAGAKWSELFGVDYLWLFSVVFTFLMLQYTEILPKTLGVRFRLFLARKGGLPLRWAVTVLSPVIAAIHFINRPFEVKGGAGTPDAISEIGSLAAMARMNNLIGSRQEKIIHSATRLNGISARQVMIPLEQVTILSSDTTIQEAFLIAHADLHTRYPVRDVHHPSRLVGYVNFKELVYFMSTNPNNPSFLGIVRPLNFIAPDTNASDLLKLFVDQHKHMVVVRDGEECQGIVTVEDVIEELVGEIEDEFDRLPQYVHGLAGRVWLVGGGTPMRELSGHLGVDLGGEGASLGVWLADAIGKGFKPGDAVRRGRYEFAVRRIKRGRIFDASVTDLDAPSPGSRGSGRKK